MKLEIRSLWSPDVTPTDGLPVDLAAFTVLVHVALGERDEPGQEVFYLTVCSPGELARTESGRFVSHTLVLYQFSWQAIRERLEELLRHTESAVSWPGVIAAVGGCLCYADSE